MAPAARFLYRPEHDARIAEGVARGLTSKQIAEELTAAYYSLFTQDMVTSRQRTAAFKSLGVEAPPDPTAEERFAAKVSSERQKAEDRAIAREMAEAVKGAARWADFLDIFQSSLSRTPAPELKQLIVPQGAGTPETMVVLVGDIHIGKLVDPNVVGEGFGYGIPIFEQRMARLKDRIVRLWSLNSATAPVERLRIYFLGDGVDGADMRRGHGHRVDVQNAMDQVTTLVYAFEAMVRELEVQLDIPVEVVWEYGNHGRIGDWGVNLPADNYDYIAGQMLGVALRDRIGAGAVKLHADSLKYSITQLGPLRVYTSHNDGIKGGDGFAGLPINGMARGSAKDTGLHQQLFDLYIMAHFHTPQDITTQTSRIIMNGAWDGGDDYSVNGLKAASEPVQWAFGVHPTKGMTWQARINLSPTRRPASPVSM